MADSKTSIAIAVLGVIGSIGAAYVTARQTGKASDVEFSKVALSVLQDKNSSDQLKEWSLGMLGKYSGVTIPPAKTKAIIDSANETGTVFPGLASEAPLNAKTIGDLLNQFSVQTTGTMASEPAVKVPMVVPPGTSAPTSRTLEYKGGDGPGYLDGGPYQPGGSENAN